jgi:hypothetical protein
MVNLDELEAKWAEYDRKLDANLRLSRRLLSAPTLKRARSALQRLIAFVALEALGTLAAAIALGNFIYENIGAARFVLPAVALDLMAIAMLASLIRQIMTAMQIDYGDPIATIQKQLVVLRMMRIRYVQRTLLAGMIGWLLLLIVAIKGFLGVDPYQLLNRAWLVANLLFGAGVIVAAVWLSRKYSDRMDRYPILQRLMKIFAGYNLNAAAHLLATLSEFEKEEP